MRGFRALTILYQETVTPSIPNYRCLAPNLLSLAGTAYQLLISLFMVWATPSPVLLADAFIVEHGPYVSWSSDGAIDHARSIQRNDLKSLSEVGLRDVVLRATRMEHIT